MKFFLTDPEGNLSWFGCLALASFLANACIFVSLLAQGIVYLVHSWVTDVQLAEESQTNLFLQTALATVFLMTVLFFIVIMWIREATKEKPPRQRPRRDGEVRDASQRHQPHT